MPPKKKKGSAVDEPVMLLGRPGNNVKMGIVGLPNVGKSSFFNVLCNMSVPAENFPFCTIDPNLARVPVPDDRFDFLVAHHEPHSVVPAVLTVTDIAGLVKGASEGAGLGNAFLSHIRACDGLYHMIRAFKNKDVSHVEESIDPIRDMEIIHEELLLKDIQTLDHHVEGARKNIERGVGGKDKKDEFVGACLFSGAYPVLLQEALERILEFLKTKKDIRSGKWSPLEVEMINSFQMLTAKPMIYLVNLSAKDYKRKANKWLPKIAEFIKGRGSGEMMIPVSCAFEQAIVDGDEAVLKEFEGCKSILPRVIRSGYRVLHLIHFFTCGKDEVRAWSLRKGALAPKAAGVIHTDFEHGFIKAEVIKYSDFKELGTELACKSAGKLRMEGKQYVMQDGDIVLFKFNVSSSGKKEKK